MFEDVYDTMPWHLRRQLDEVGLVVGSGAAMLLVRGMLCLLPPLPNPLPCPLTHPPTRPPQVLAHVRAHPDACPADIPVR